MFQEHRSLTMRVGSPRLAASLMLLAITSAIVSAQSFSGMVRGTATDPTGAVLTNVKVTLFNENTNESRTQTTNALGTYTFPQVPPGDYRLEAETPGFKRFVRPRITVELQQEA